MTHHVQSQRSTGSSKTCYKCRALELGCMYSEVHLLLRVVRPVRMCALKLLKNPCPWASPPGRTSTVPHFSAVASIIIVETIIQVNYS